MRRILSVSLAATLFAGTGLALAQQPEAAVRPTAQRIFWQFDPIHGVMQPVVVAGSATPGSAPARSAPETTASAKTYTGTVDIAFTVNLISTRPPYSVLRCSGSVALAIEEETTTTPLNLGILLGDLTAAESVDPTLSDNTAKCQFKIPYSWTVPASTSTTTITIQGISGAVGIAADELDANGAVIRTYRSSSTPLPGPIPLPQDGATISLTASSVL
jgi:hypothetical protein